MYSSGTVQPFWQRRWRVKSVIGGVPSHTFCRRRDSLLSLRRECSDRGQRRKREVGRQRDLKESLSCCLPLDSGPRTSKTLQREDPPPGPRAHPVPLVLSTHHPQLCCHTLKIFLARFLVFLHVPVSPP